MKKETEKMVSRRVFLANTGKLVGICVLSHFAMVGKAKETFSSAIADNGSSKSLCVKAFVCDENAYSCSSSSRHSCATLSQFSCGTNFNCNPLSSNKTNDKCIPLHAQAE